MIPSSDLRLLEIGFSKNIIHIGGEKVNYLGDEFDK